MAFCHLSQAQFVYRPALIDGKQNKDTMDRRVSPKPMPEGAMRALHWIADHAREYKGQWVALDGDRLIAHGANADEVFDAAETYGDDLPLVGFVDDPDKVYAGF
jgi:hypothetical protein